MEFQINFKITFDMLKFVVIHYQIIILIHSSLLYYYSVRQFHFYKFHNSIFSLIVFNMFYQAF
jgi:hypothetical protein